jgi:hypothetical protein
MLNDSRFKKKKKKEQIFGWTQKFVHHDSVLIDTLFNKVISGKQSNNCVV